MTTDILLNDQEVIVKSPYLTVVPDSDDKASTSINLQNATGFWHLSGPRTYEKGNPLSVFWNDHSNWSAPFLTILTNGRVGIGTNAPKNTLHVHGGEIESTGPGAGFAFMARDKDEAFETKNERFVWYCDKGKARLWENSEGDLLTIDAGSPQEGPSLNLAGVITANTVVTHEIYLNGESLSAQQETIAELQKQVAALQEAVSKLS